MSHHDEFDSREDWLSVGRKEKAPPPVAETGEPPATSPYPNECDLCDAPVVFRLCREHLEEFAPPVDVAALRALADTLDVWVDGMLPGASATARNIPKWAAEIRAALLPPEETR